MKPVLQLVIAMSLLISARGGEAHPYLSQRDAWLNSGDPQLLFDAMASRSWDDLPLEGQLEREPWSGPYWPGYLRGLAWRWQASYPGVSPVAGLPHMPGKQLLMRMSPDALSLLSPAEKYDIAKGRYDYPLTRAELYRTNPNNPAWWGLCHGWAAAAVHFKEPGMTPVTNPDGLVIDFYSADIKALLSFAQQYQRKAEDTRFMAMRCYEDISLTPGGGFLSPACKDANAGAFHLALVEAIAVRRSPLIVDLQQNFEVWNVPLHSYRTQILDANKPVHPGAALGTARVVEVETEVTYASLSQPQKLPFSEFNYLKLKKIQYRYLIELDREGIVVGGEWVTNGTPDFLWFQKPFQFSGYFQSLESIYTSSVD